MAERLIEIADRRGMPDLLMSVEPLRGFLQELDEGYPAAPPGRWVFPSVGAWRGSDLARKAERASQGRDTSHLRLVTLRVGDRKPATGELADHLRLLSEAARSCCDYLARRGAIRPILSVIQLRRDRSVEDPPTVFDPHVHGIWEVPQEAIDGVRRYLNDRFASVWIDDVPVQDLKAAIFYVASGMLDYRDVPSWPDEAIEALWTLPGMRMIRPAGWLADPSRADDGSKIDLEARQMGSRRQERNPVQSRSKTDQRGANAVTERRIPSGRLRAKARTSTPTVRGLASESLNLGKTPTLSELWFVREVISGRLAGKPTAFEDICTGFGIPPSEGIEAVLVTEASLRATLFYPGEDWIPTANAVSFIERTLPLLVAFSDLYVDLRSEAEAAGERLSKKGTGLPQVA